MPYEFYCRFGTMESLTDEERERISIAFLGRVGIKHGWVLVSADTPPAAAAKYYLERAGEDDPGRYVLVTPAVMVPPGKVWEFEMSRREPASQAVN